MRRGEFMEDAEIVSLFFERSEQAIRETEKKYSRYLTKIAQNILCDPEDSAECVNDTYLKAWNSIPPHKPEHLNCFLGKITRELSIDICRRKNAAKRGGSEYELSLDELSDCVSGSDSLEQSAEFSALSAAISDYLRTCGEDAKNVFISRYYFCDSVKKIAGIYGMSVPKVKSLLFRTRAGLKKYLEKEGFSV